MNSFRFVKEAVSATKADICPRSGSGENREEDLVMSRTTICPKCKSVQATVESPSPGQSEVACGNCGGPLTARPTEDAASRPPTILWIDDDRLLLSFGSDALEQLGYRVLIAADGPSGIQTAKTERPDLIILDVLMPNMDGFEVCRLLRAEPGLKSTPIFLLTALEDPKVGFWGRDVGATFTMNKPYGAKQIIKTIEDLLSRKLGPPPLSKCA
jgi:CheY-like chemotaxis protein